MDFNSFIWGLFGSGVGGALVWLAAKKVIDDRVDKKLEPVWAKIDNFKNDYVSKEVCQVTHEHAEKDNKRIEDSLLRIENLIREMPK